MRALLYISGVALLSLAIGCAPPSEPPEEAAAAPEPAVVNEATLDQLARDWDEAWNSGDASQTADLYADGATMMPPESPAMEGKEAIRGFVEAMHAQGKMTVRDEVSGYYADADTIAAHGTWTLDIAPAEDDVMQDSGRWMAMWGRQDDGSWKALRNIWNSDRLPEGMPPHPGSGVAPAEDVPQPEAPICPTDLAGLNDAFGSTLVAGDLAGNVATHSENGVRHPPYMETVSGHAAMTSFINAYLETFDPRELTVNTGGTYDAGNWGAAWGTYAFSYTMSDGSGSFDGGGKYMTVASKDEAGCWRSDWVLWNSDTPPM